MDRHDAGGWLVLSCGVIIIAITVLAPAYLDVQRAKAQASLMDHQLLLLEAHQRNYRQFIAAMDAGDPQLLERLAWFHLRLRPAKTELFDPPTETSTLAAPSLAHWLRPRISTLPPESAQLAYPDTRLVRLVTGAATRPWVLAFGAWLIFMGLILNPRSDRPSQPALPLSVSASSVPHAAF